ncbi:MAG: FHA domain-containing protein [Granulosicoccus sp.]
MTTIIVTHENNETDEFVFDASKIAITFGRRSTNDVCIPDLSVSGNHATLTISDGEVIFEDLNSTNGSYVNGEVIQRTAIQPGDEIILGKILVSFSTETGDTGVTGDDVRKTDESAKPATEDASTVLHTPDKLAASDLLQPLSIEPTTGELAADSGVMATPNGMSGNAGASNDTSSEPPLAAASNDQPATQVDATETASRAEPTANVSSVSEHGAGSQGGKGSGKNHPLDGIEHLVVPTAKPAATPMHELDSPHKTSKGAVIEIKNGAKSGQILPIDKPVTTLGRPGIQIAAIMRKPDGYFLMHIESDDSIERPTLNSDSVGDEPVLLHSGDELTVAGIDVEFMLS